MSTSVRMLVAAAFVAATYGVVLAIQQMGMPIEARAPKRDLRELPTGLGPWVAEEGSGGGEAVVDDDAELRTARTYRNAAGETVSLYVAVWQEYLSRTPHPPEGCYTRSGFKLLERKTIRVQFADQPDVPVRVLLLEREGKRISVLYWYQRGRDVLLYTRFWRRATWTSEAGKDSPPLVKVMLETTASDAEKAESRLKSIAVPLFAWTKDL